MFKWILHGHLKTQNHLPTHSSGCTLLVLTGFFLSRESRINVRVRLLILGLFSSGYVLIKGGMFINFLTFFIFLIFFTSFPLAMCKKIEFICYFKGGLCLFKGLCLLFLRNVPGATFIQGGTSIPESRVLNLYVIQ